MPTDNTPRDLRKLVLDRITQLGALAPEYFGVSESTIQNWLKGRVEPSLKAAQKAWDESLLCNTPEVWGASGNTPVTLLMPLYESLEPMTFFTLIRACKLYGMDKINIIPKWRTLIEEARNDLAEKFLLTSGEYCIFPDADGVFPCGSSAILNTLGCDIVAPKANLNFIERLMSHPKEMKIVGALYRDRRGGNRAQCEGAFKSPLENSRLLNFFKIPTGEPEKHGWVGFGAVRIHRSVFEQMKAEMRAGGKLADLAPPPGRENEPYGYFGRNSKQRGEDVAFCRRAQAIGIETWVDTGLCLGHIGKKVY